MTKPGDHMAAYLRAVGSIAMARGLKPGEAMAEAWLEGTEDDLPEELQP